MSQQAVCSVPNYENAQIEAANMLEVVFYKKGTILVRQNEVCNGLYYVIDGILELGYSDKSGKYRELHDVKPGGLSGYVGTILGYRSFTDICAKTNVYLAVLSRSALEYLSDRYPMISLNMAKTLTSVLSRFILSLDYALEWVHVQTGQVLFNQGDEADAIYIVLNGRLRSVTSSEDKKKPKVLGEYGQGESIGELEVLTMSKCPYTLHAIRESELAKFPRSLFECLALQHPSVMFEISRLVASRVRKRIGDSGLSIHDMHMASESNFRTIAVIPITEGMPVTEFGQKLLAAYKDNSHKAIILNNASVLNYLGRHAFNKMGRLKMSGHLTDLAKISDSHLCS